MRAALTLVVSFALLPLAGCHDPVVPTGPSTPVTISGVTILGGPTSSMGVGQTVHLRAVQTYTNNTSIPITAGVTWSSSLPGVAAVDVDGNVLAVAAGSTTVTGTYQTYTNSVTVRVVQNWLDLDFRVVILNGGSDGPVQADVIRIFAKANDFLFERTGSRMRLVDMADAGPGTSVQRATQYLDMWSGEQPDGIVVWSDDPTAVSAGGFSQTVSRPAPYVNRFPALAGSNRLYVSTIDYDHMYARCGYDTTGASRISDRSGNGECRNQAGLVCVNTGRYWQCPDTLNDLYSQPDAFIASTIVHEFMHPVGQDGNNDHYGTATCTARMSMSAAEAADHNRFQWHMGQCPDLFLRFRPTGAPSALRR
ncbi:MAG TPA: Ig-like domain-containing protein [Vicinamibacterales bacterium]|nr:Ig-like domain-containing protein [Vicinamibacterales bacterium]